MVWDLILLQAITPCLWSHIVLTHICYFISITVAINADNFA